MMNNQIINQMLIQPIILVKNKKIQMITIKNKMILKNNNKTLKSKILSLTIKKIQIKSKMNKKIKSKMKKKIRSKMINKMIITKIIKIKITMINQK